MLALPLPSPPTRVANHFGRCIAGMPCGVDSGANAVLPHAVRSCRATSLFHTLKASRAVGRRLFVCAGMIPAG